MFLLKFNTILHLPQPVFFTVIRLKKIRNKLNLYLYEIFFKNYKLSVLAICFTGGKGGFERSLA